MWASLLLSAFAPVGVLSAAICGNSSRFLAPDDGSFIRDGKVNQFPLSFNLTDSLFKAETQIDGSFWVNSFISATNGHKYYIASHVQSYSSDIPGALPAYRATLLDVTDPSLYRNFIRFGDESATFWTSEGHFEATIPGFGVEALTEDPLQGLHMYSSLEGIEFDLTFNFTSPVLLNAALGGYWVGGALGWEWSVPRGATAGSLTIDGEKIDVIAEKSFSWYDRQWGSLQDSFDWIAVNFEKSDWLDIHAMAIWKWEDAVNGPKEFATYRSASTSYDSVIPVTMTPSETNVWTSPETGTVWPQEWRVTLGDIELIVTSPRQDQVIEPPIEIGFPHQFSGYVDVVAKKAGYPPVRGYGAVDRMAIPA